MTRTQRCITCGTMIAANAYECPQCGHVYTPLARRSALFQLAALAVCITFGLGALNVLIMAWQIAQAAQ